MRRSEEEIKELLARVAEARGESARLRSISRKLRAHCQKLVEEMLRQRQPTIPVQQNPKSRASQPNRLWMRP